MDITRVPGKLAVTMPSDFSTEAIVSLELRNFIDVPKLGPPWTLTWKINAKFQKFYIVDLRTQAKDLLLTHENADVMKSKDIAV